MAPPSSTNGVRYRSAPSISSTFCATSSSRSQGKYKPPRKPPQALKVQATPRRRPLPSMTKVGPQSRIQASLLVISTTRTCGGKRARAFWNWAADAPTVTGSPWTIAAATAANAACAGFAPSRQLSGRSGHNIQQPEWRSYSAGMRKPSPAGVDVSMRNASLQPRMLALRPHLGTSRACISPLLRSWQKRRFLPAETKLMSDKRAGARLVDRRSTRRVPSRDGMAQKAPQATFSNEPARLYFQARADFHDTVG